MAGTKTEAVLTRFREAGGSEWTVTTAGRYEPYVAVGYHRPGEDLPAVNVRLYPGSYALAAEVSYGDTNESFTDVQAAYQYVEELLEDFLEEGETEDGT